MREAIALPVTSAN